MPLEIDNVAMELAEVYQAVSFAAPHPTLGEDIAMAVVLNENVSITTMQIREYLFAHLADYKIPSQVIIVDEIPKGATGKLQRIGLVDKLKDKLETNNILPSNEIQKKIAEIWHEVLNLESISIEDNFFILGGDSIKGTQIVNRINKIFNLNLINVILFQKPTIAQLAIVIAEENQSNYEDEITQLANELQNLSPEEIKTVIRRIKILLIII